MKRLSALFAFIPQRYHHLAVGSGKHSHLAQHKFSLLPTQHSSPSTINRAFMSSSTNTNDNNQYYLLSRNGIQLPWNVIHEKYKDTISNNKNNSNSSLDASTLLQLLPRGAYTTCRTIKNGSYIYQFDYHMDRLVVSSRSILENIIVSGSGGEEEEDTNKVVLDIDWERELLISCSAQQKLEYIRSTIDEFRARNNMIEGRDFRITLLATWEKKDDETKCQDNEEEDERPQSSNLHSFQSVLYCHVGYLPQSSSNSTIPTTQSSSSIGEEQKKKHIQVLIHGHGRQNALAKDSKWVLDRKQLITPNGYEEIILLNDSNELLEGTQTNFYVVTNTSTVITANEGILFGSVRDSVLRVCDLHDIQVELRPPTLEDLRYASGVFITSTSRLVMPVHEVVLGDLQSSSLDTDDDVDQKKKDRLLTSYCYPNCATTEDIRKWVLEDVETHSTSIYN